VTSKRATIAVIAVVAASLGAVAESQEGSGPPPGGPPPEAIKACTKQTAGAACSFTGRGGQKLTGSCFAPPGRVLACRPVRGPGGAPPPGGPSEGGAPGGGPPDRGGGGTAIAATRLSTAGVGCALRHDAPNAAIGIASRYAWSCDDSSRTLVANGIPDHATGAFPNSGNPNRIAAQTVSIALPLKPVAETRAWLVKIAGYALNGIKFDPGTAESCTVNCGNGGRGPGGPWRIEALGQKFFDFGVDANNAHVQPDGAYHYHGVPNALVRRDRMTLIGWASDGYPIYGRYGHAAAMDPASPVRPMRSSYRLKSAPDAGRPAISIAPMGTFTQDYAYVAGSGDLDECNGRRDVTPEFPNGAYHYYATDSYPYIQRCTKGRPAPGADDRPRRLFG